jgi:cytosine/adenosine deaminase-related metal-dependent hydrolase
MSTAPWSLTARWVFPVAGPPLEGGTLTIEGDRIRAVEPHGATRADLDLGDCAVLPGLVNAHTHLDLTGMRGLSPPGPDFTAWLRQVVHHRRQRGPEQIQADIRAGLAECVRTGTTLVGDISGDGASWDALAGGPARAVVFREVLGLPADRAAAAWQAFDAWRRAHPATPTCRPGVSPHAPYSTRLALYAEAAEAGLPLATHLAESRDELELLARRRGPFVDFLQALGVWAPGELASGPGQVLGLLGGRGPVVLAHANYLAGDQEIPDNATVVYCPRTHAAFGHDAHPYRDLLRRGVRVALGTDGLASNPDLDMRAEARCLLEVDPYASAEAVLRMLTLSGAEALGWAEQTGSLEPGKSADLVAWPVGGVADDPHRAVLLSTAPVARVLCRGAWVVG